DIYTSGRTTPFGTSSYPDYLDLKSGNDTFDDIAGYTPMFAAMNLDTRSRLVMGEVVTGNYFRMLGVRPAAGRLLGVEDDRADAPRVVVVSHRYWTLDLGSAADVVGRVIRI